MRLIPIARGIGNNIWGQFWKITKRMMTRSETKNMSLHLFFLQWGNYFKYKVFSSLFVNKIELPIGYKYKLPWFYLSCQLQGSGSNICMFRKTKFTSIKAWLSRAESIQEIDRTIMLGFVTQHYKFYAEVNISLLVLYIYDNFHCSNRL